MDSSDNNTLSDKDAEVLAIGALLTADANTQLRIQTIVGPHDFFFEQNRGIAQAGLHITNIGRPIDAAMVLTVAANHQIHIGSAQYLMDLAVDPLVTSCSIDSAIMAANRVRNLSLIRTTKARLLQAVQECTNTAQFQQLIERVSDDISDLSKIASSSRSGATHIETFLAQDIDLIQEAADNPDQKRVKGAPTGITELDEATNGVQPEQLAILGARPSMGKTAFALNIAEAAAEAGWTVLIYSLETPGAGMTRRSVSASSRIPLDTLKSGQLSDMQWSDYSSTIEKLRGLPIWIDDTPELTPPEIQARTRQFVSKYPHTLVIGDYLQLVAEPEGFTEKRNVHVAAVSRMFKSIARTLKIPVIALAQLSREIETRVNKRPLMADLKESGQIEQDADHIWFIYRDEYYNPESKDKGLAEIIVGKNKDGPKPVIRTVYRGEIVRFLNLAKDFNS